MSVCYAWERKDGQRLGSCWECGHYYWEHSHWLDDEWGGKPRRKVIRWGQAQIAYWDLLAGLSGPISRFTGDLKIPPPDSRLRYEMMMDRTPAVCDFVANIMVKERNRMLKPGRVFQDSMGRPVGVILPNGGLVQQGTVRL